MIFVCITLGTLLLHSANAVHFDGMSAVCAITQCDWALEDLGSCEHRDNFASCVEKCGESLATTYMRRGNEEYLDIACKIRNNTLDDVVIETLHHFRDSCDPQEDACKTLLTCLGAIRKTSLGKQGLEKDVLKIVEIDSVLMYITLALGDPKQDIPQSCADILSGKDA